MSKAGATMSTGLYGRHGDKSFSAATWDGCFHLAVAFGWKPAGTNPPVVGAIRDDWDGGYFSNEFQQVTDDDARAMARALTRALTALKARRRVKKEQAKAWTCKSVNIFDVCDLVRYANKGGFLVGYSQS